MKDSFPVTKRDFFGSSTVDGASVVDEDVDAAELVFDLGEEVFGAVGRAEVRTKGGCVSTKRGCSFVGGAAVAVAGYGGSCLRERCGNGSAEAAGGTCDEGYFVVETKEVEDVLHG